MGVKLSLAFFSFLFFFLVSLDGGFSVPTGDAGGGKLKMYVDELPKIPKIHGYKLRRGIPVAKKLTIGMYHKKWVRIFFFLHVKNIKG